VKRFISTDGQSQLSFEAKDLEAALEVARPEWTDCWEDVQETMWIKVHVYEEDDPENEGVLQISVDPPEPKCLEGHEHDWIAPHELVGGLEENPGVFGSGGGVIIKEVCRHCGTLRQIDTWATNPVTGEQGLKSVSFEDRKFLEEVSDDS
jgi:hypothetical protein